MEIYFRKMTLSWLLATVPFLGFLLLVGYCSVTSISLPPNPTISHYILLAFCILIYVSAWWFCIANLWTSVKHEFNDKVITRYSFLGFSRTRVRSRDDVKETKIIETSSAPFASRGFFLQIVFKDGAKEPVFSDKNFDKVQAIQHQIEAYLTEGNG
ncbi:MAG TPA: hypothetical protein VH413_02005 [Verrucomicrobiae bacterium]|nr:hypothetical protein [Verrucomicrobiae bacterium]